MTFVTYLVASSSGDRTRPLTSREFGERFARASQCLATEPANLLRPLIDDSSSWDLVPTKPYDEISFHKAVSGVLEHEFGRQEREGFEIPVGQVRRDLLRARIEALPPGRVLAACSRCRYADGSVKHIPMMDFRCAPSDYFVRLTQASLKAVGELDGVILHSGRSLHYYGKRLLDEASWRLFLTRCILLAPLADARYIAHRLLDDIAVLRISAAPGKPMEPKVLAHL